MGGLTTGKKQARGNRTTESQLAVARHNKLLNRYRRSKVLIVEDNPESRGMLRQIMQDAGVEHIELASSGDEAMECIKSRSFDLVLCDYNLGKGKDGQQILEEARFGGHLRYSSIFIMITAETSIEMVMGALEYQPDSYVSKPFTRQELTRRIDRAYQVRLEYHDIEAAFGAERFSTTIELCDAKIQHEEAMRASRIKGECLLRLGSYKDAGLLYQEVISQRPLVWARLGLARCFHATGQLEAAADLLARLIDEQPTVTESYDWLARVQLAQGAARAAQETLELAVARSPRAVQRQMELAKVAFTNGSYLVAEYAYRKSILLSDGSCHHNPDVYLQYVRSLLVKIDETGNQLSRDTVKEALLFLERLRKAFNRDTIVDFRATLLEAQVMHVFGSMDACRSLLEGAVRRYELLPACQRITLAEEYVAGMVQAGQIEHSETFTHEFQKRFDEPLIAGAMLQLIAEGKLRMESETLNKHAIALYRRGQIMDAYMQFSAAAAMAGASVAVLMNAANVCLELAERADLNSADWREKCAAYLARLQGLDRGDHRFEVLQGYRARFSLLEPAEET